MKVKVKFSFAKTPDKNHFWMILGAGYGRRCLLIWILIFEIQIILK